MVEGISEVLLILHSQISASAGFHVIFGAPVAGDQGIYVGCSVVSVKELVFLMFHPFGYAGKPIRVREY